MDQEIDLINKNTRNERIINFFKKNYKIFILSISLIIIIILLFFGLEYLNKKKNIKLSNMYNNIISSYELKNKNFVIEELKKIIEQKNKTYSPLSLFFLIDKLTVKKLLHSMIKFIFLTKLFKTFSILKILFSKKAFIKLKLT